MNELVKLDVAQYGLQESKAKDIEKLYLPMIKMLSEMEESFNEVVSHKITADLIPIARRLKIDIAQVRIKAEKAKTEAKSEILRAGNAIQGAYNTLKYAVESKEEKLTAIINHFETLEKERLEKLQLDRAEKLSKYIEDAFERDLSSMDDDVWNAFYAAKKQAYNDKIEAEKKAEQDRIEKEKAEQAERLRITKENEQLKKEAIKRERLEKIESDKRVKAEQDRLAKAEAERKERERLEAIERKKHEAELQKERDAKAKIQRELEAKAEAERKRNKLIQDEKAEQIAKQKAALLAPDKDKLNEFSKTIRNIKFPDVKSLEALNILENVQNLLTKTSKYIDEKSEQLA